MGDLFDAYFKRADLDGDGQISGAEAVAFFQGSGLPKQVLAQVWTYADQRKAGFLSKQDFYNALKLVTVAQSKRDLTPDIVKAALYGPASAKIPAPQISLAAPPGPRPAAPAPRPATPAPQMVGATSVAAQIRGIRPPLVPGNASTNQQYFTSQQNQFMRPLQGIRTPVPVSNPQQMLANQGLPRGGSMTASLPSNSISSTDWSGGSMGIATTQNQNRVVSSAATRVGFGPMASGTLPAVQPSPQVTMTQTFSTPPKTEDAAASSSQSKVSGNGLASEPPFGDIFSVSLAQPAQSSSLAAPSTTGLPGSSPIVSSTVGSQPSVELAQGSSSTVPSASVLPVSSSVVTSGVGSQFSARPSSLDTLQSAFSQQPVGGQLTETLSNTISGQTSTVTSEVSVGAGNLASNQSELPWPKMTRFDIQKYMKVFVQVDTDRDGKITGEQARNLFLSWRLPREVLKQVWDLSDQDNDSMLSLREFCTALYLMERYREGHRLPTTLPNSVMSDETLLSATSHSTVSHRNAALGHASVLRQSQVMPGPRPTHPSVARPPRPPAPHVHHVDERQPNQQKPKVPVLEKHLVDQLSQDEQDSINSKFQEATQADKKVEELEKDIVSSRQKIEFYRVKMQELILYKSRCDNRLNEVSERVIADKCEVEVLAKKYEEKYRQAGDVASKLTIEEATFHDIQDKKMEVYRAIVKIEEGDTADGVLKDRAEHIRSSLEELVKSVNERCKQYGLRAKPISLVELPFGWQPGIQEAAADWDGDWDKFEDEGFAFVKELTLDVQNVVAPPKSKPSVQKAASTNQDSGTSPSKAEEKSEKISSPRKPINEKESPHDWSENGVARSPPESPSERSATERQSHDLRESSSRKETGADVSRHAKDFQSDVGGIISVHTDDRIGDVPQWGTFDTHYDTESNWGSESVSGKDLDHHGESPSFGLNEFGLNPIKTGSSRVDNMYQGKGTSLFAESVPSTPAYNQGRSTFPDSVPSTPAYDQGRSLFADSVPSTPANNQGRSLFADSVPSTPAYNQGRGLFADSVPSTPAYNQGNSSFGFADSVPGSPAYNFGNSFDNFSRFDSFSLPDSGSFQSPHHSLGRFDSMRSTRDSDEGYGFPSRFDSFRDSDQDQGFARFDSFRETDQSHGIPRFDSFRDSNQNLGFSRFDSLGDSNQSHGFSRFDSFKEIDNSRGFSSSFDSFNPNETGFFQSTGNLFSRSDSVRSSNDLGTRHAFTSFDDNDPFGSAGPFRPSIDSETPRNSSDNWKAF